MYGMSDIKIKTIFGRVDATGDHSIDEKTNTFLAEHDSEILDIRMTPSGNGNYATVMVIYRDVNAAG